MRNKIIYRHCLTILLATVYLLNYGISISAQTIPHNLPSKLKVKQIKINGSSVFTPSDFKSMVEPLIGKEVTLEKILRLRTDITNLYVEKGYTTSGAFFPIQDSSDGVVNIQVIEGQLEDIKIAGLNNLRKSYIKSRFKLADDIPLNIRNLERAIQLLQQNSIIDSVDAQLTSGSAPGLSVLQLAIKEAPSVSTLFTIANNQSPNIGEYSATAAIAHQNLLGFGDRFSAEYALTDGLDRYGLSYSLPINAHDGNLFAGYGNNNSEVTDSFFSAVDIESQSSSVNFGLRQPIIRKPQSEVALSLALDLRESETFLDEETFSFDPDRLGESGKSRVTALRFTQEWLSRSGRNVIGTSSQFSLGIDAFDATIDNTGKDGRFFSWLGQFQWLRALNNERNALLITRFATQFTPDSLLSIEQFALGGQGSVRGYEQNQLIGDNGILSSVELRIPLVQDSDTIGLIQLAPFIDAGTVWGNGSEDDSFIASLGLGINWELSEKFSLQAYYGFPLVDVEDMGDSLQSDGLTFSLQLVPLKF